jgi:hypothetical protein
MKSSVGVSSAKVNAENVSRNAVKNSFIFMVVFICGECC